MCTDTNLMVVAGLEPEMDALTHWATTSLKLFDGLYLNLFKHLKKIENQSNQNISLCLENKQDHS